jgi:hypothetical protein
MNHYIQPRYRTDYLAQPKHWKMDIMDLRETGLGGCGLDSTGSGQVPVAGCGECGDEPSGS